MPINLNEKVYAGGGTFEVIPEDTIATMIINVEPDEATGHPFRQSKTTDAVYMKCKVIVTNGPYAKKWFYYNMTLNGGKRNEHGQSKAGIISGKTVRQIVESAKGIGSKDTDEAAIRGRVIDDYPVIHGMEFCGRIGIEPEKPPYPARNKLKAALPADHKDYIRPASATHVRTVAVEPGQHPAPQADAVTPGPDSSDGPSASAPAPAPTPAPAPAAAPAAGVPTGQPSWRS